MRRTWGGTFNADNNMKFKNIKKIKLRHRWHNNLVYKDAYWKKFGVIAQPNSYTATGSIKTSGMIVGVPIQYLNTQIYEERGGFEDLVTLSGSVDNGATWVKLNKNTDTDMTTPGTTVILQYIMKPSGSVSWITSGTSWDTDTPTLSRMVLTGWNTSTGGIPKSGSRVTYSDDITIAENEVVYPPSWSAWNSYTSPKLRLTDDETYWIILMHDSGSGKYWDIYYDPDSIYTDGRIAYSWNDGVNWSSNANCPEEVPSGSIGFRLGWSQDTVTYASSNTSSIATYGRHFKKIIDSAITTEDLAKERAIGLLSDTIPKKGNVTINGTIAIGLNYRLSSNYTNFDIAEKNDIVSYTQKIDNKGFTTTIEYGKQKFDISKKLSTLESEVGI